MRSAIIIAAAGAAVALIGATVAVAAFFGVVTAGPPCEEDQAYVVREDRDPAHGLTWHCVALDDLIQAATPSPAPATPGADLRVLPPCPRISVRRGDPRYDELAIARAICERTGR